MTETYGPSTVNRRRRSTAELAVIDDAVVAAVADEHPASLRGVYYRVVSAGAVEKTELGYRLVGRELLKLRRAGVVPYSWITDGTRWVTKPDTFGSVDQMLENAAASYRRALWHDQCVEVHVFTEKDAISGVVSGVTGRWDVPLGVLRGYCSESFAHSMAEALDGVGKPVFVYQLGDHDPSGIDAWRDFQRKVGDFLRAAQIDRLGRSVGIPVVFERLAVTEAQIEELHLPTRPTKRSDSRSAGFTGGSVEVDAIPPRILRQLVEDAITRHIDPHALDLTLSVERSEREVLERMVGGWSA